MLRKDMSSSPPLGGALPKINKFVGESFGTNSNVRVIYAGAEEDRLKRESRVILLLGPVGSGKAALIDFLCNHFYGATLESSDRYHIANERFGASTPEKDIITYVFNDTIMDFRPIVIDTPGTGQLGSNAELSRLLQTWIRENERLRIDVVGVVFSHTIRLSADEEFHLQETLNMMPAHLRNNFVVFITGSDGSAKPDAVLRRFNLHEAKAFKVNTSCLFQKRQDEALHEHLRGTYWRMTTGNFTELFFYIRQLKPVTFSGAEPELPMLSDPNRSSGSSSIHTMIHHEPTIHKTTETTTRTWSAGGVQTVTSKISTDNSRTTEEKTIVHPPTPVWKPNYPPPPPPNLSPPPPTDNLPMTSGLPKGLLQDIQKHRGPDSSSEDDTRDVIVVNYPEASPEVVILHKSPTPPREVSNSRKSPLSSSFQQSTPPRLEEFPPPLTPTLNRPYDLPPTEFYKTVTFDENERSSTTRFSSLGTRVTVGGGILSTTSDVRSGAEASNISTTYSTVAFMNNDGTTTVDKMTAHIPIRAKSYTPYDSIKNGEVHNLQTTPVKNLYDQVPSATRTYDPYKEDINKTPETPSTVVLRSTPAPSLSQQMRHSHTPERTTILTTPEPFLRSQSTRHPPQGEIVRYVYDVNSRSHMGYSVGERGRSSVRKSKTFDHRESKSLEAPSRQPYYEASGYTITRTPSRSMNSLHRSHPELSGPELVHSEDNYAYIDPLTKKPKEQTPVRSPRRETIIDFPMSDQFHRNDGNRKSIRSPPGTQQDPISPGPIPARRTSAPRNLDRGSKIYPPPTDIDNRDNPAYSIGGKVTMRENPRVSSTFPRESIVSRELRERENILRDTTINVNRQSYPSPPTRQYENIYQPTRYENIETGVLPQRQSQVGRGVTPISPSRNDYIIPPQMRENNQPIQVTVDMAPKGTRQSIGQGVVPLQEQNRGQPPKYEGPPLPPHGYREQDYGDNWDGETAIIVQGSRRREEGRTQGQRPADLRIGEGATVNRGTDPRSPGPPPYNSRPYPNTPDARGKGGDDDDGYIVREETTLVQGGSTKGRKGGYYGYSRGGPQRGQGELKTTVTTETTTKGRKKTRRVTFLNWNPCRCDNMRDCLLNVICFIIAPLFLIAVIIVIIVISVTAK